MMKHSIPSYLVFTLVAAGVAAGVVAAAGGALHPQGAWHGVGEPSPANGALVAQAGLFADDVFALVGQLVHRVTDVDVATLKALVVLALFAVGAAAGGVMEFASQAQAQSLLGAAPAGVSVHEPVVATAHDARGVGEPVLGWCDRILAAVNGLFESKTHYGPQLDGAVLFGGAAYKH